MASSSHFPSHSHSHSSSDNFSSNGQSYIDPLGFDIKNPIVSHDSPECAGTQVQPPQASHPMFTRAKNGIFKPKIYTLSTGSDVDPSNYIETPSDPNWKAAMEVEYAALMKNDTWDQGSDSLAFNSQLNRLQVGV